MLTGSESTAVTTTASPLQLPRFGADRRPWRREFGRKRQEVLSTLGDRPVKFVSFERTVLG